MADHKSEQMADHKSEPTRNTDQFVVMHTGHIGSGKSTASKILKEYGFAERAFADPIKIFALSIGFKYRQVYGTQQDKLEIHEDWGISFREFAQKFGTEFGREILPKILPKMNMNGRNFWARVMEVRSKNIKYLTISDGRFPDEAKLVRDKAGVIIKLERKCDVVHDEATKNHASETQVSQIAEDYLIENNGNFTDLKTAIDNVLRAHDFEFDTEDNETENYDSELNEAELKMTADVVHSETLADDISEDPVIRKLYADAILADQVEAAAKIAARNRDPDYVDEQDLLTRMLNWTGLFRLGQHVIIADSDTESSGSVPNNEPINNEPTDNKQNSVESDIESASEPADDKTYVPIDRTDQQDLDDVSSSDESETIEDIRIRHRYQSDKNMTYTLLMIHIGLIGMFAYYLKTVADVYSV